MGGVKSRRPSSPRRVRRPSAGASSAKPGGSGAKPSAAGIKPRGPATKPGSPKLAARANRGTMRHRRDKATGLKFTTKRGTYSISWRAIMLLVTLAFSLAIVASPLQHYLQQREQARALQTEVTELQADIAKYEREKARWQNPDFVASQARDRLGWVLPGETPYVVVDPNTVTGEKSPDDPRRGVPEREIRQPWYLTIADSVEIAAGLKEAPDAGN